MEKSNSKINSFIIDDKSARTIEKATVVYTDLTNQLVLISKMTLEYWNQAKSAGDLDELLPNTITISEELGKLISRYDILLQGETDRI